MSEPGANLETYNQELMKCLEDLKTKRSDLVQVVAKEEEEKRSLEKNLETLQEKLARINANLERHKFLCNSYEKTIHDTESGYKKVSEVLASNVVKKDDK